MVYYIFSKLFYIMDNRYHKQGCPPLMSDGRFVTSYVDSGILNQFIRHVNEIGSAQDFKNFLTNNAEEIMNKERKFITNKNTCDVNGKCSGKIEGFDNNIICQNSIGEIDVENFPSNASRFDSAKK